MRKSDGRLVQALLALRSRLGPYRPEMHYMRGPGPKTLGKLGEAFRAEAESDVRKRIPEQWQALIQSIAQRERGAPSSRFPQRQIAASGSAGNIIRTRRRRRAN
jgi:uncharacterized membrane protein YccC